MGRKRTHDDAPRNCVISVRLRQATFELVTTEAVRLRLSRGGYVEHLIENRKPLVPVADGTTAYVPLVNQLKRIGNNVNQIAYSVNAGMISPAARNANETLRTVIDLLLRHELLAGNPEALEMRRAFAVPLPAPAPEPPKETPPATEPVKPERGPAHDSEAAPAPDQLQKDYRLRFERRLKEHNR